MRVGNLAPTLALATEQTLASMKGVGLALVWAVAWVVGTAFVWALGSATETALQTEEMMVLLKAGGLVAGLVQGLEAMKEVKLAGLLEEVLADPMAVGAG